MYFLFVDEPIFKKQLYARLSCILAKRWFCFGAHESSKVNFWAKTVRKVFSSLETHVKLVFKYSSL